MAPRVHARRITTPRPQSASTTSRLSTRRTAREKSCLAPAADRRRSPTNATKARCVLDASKTAPLRKTSCQQDASPAPRRPRNEMPQHNTPTQHILLGRRDTSPTVESLQGPTRRLKTTNSPRSALAPASTAHLLRGHHALLHVDNGFVEITINYARGGSAGFTSLHLNHNARRIPEETMMVSSTRLDVVVPQAPCVRDVLPIVSGRCRATIRARRATTSSQRSRCPSTRSRLVRARRPSRAATIPHSQWHFTAPPPHTHLALDGLPSFQRRGSPDSWCVDDAPRQRRRPKVSARADEQR